MNGEPKHKLSFANFELDAAHRRLTCGGREVRLPPKAFDVLVYLAENAGRTIDYANIVTSWTRIGEWDGAGQLDMSVPVKGADPVVVILQEPGPGMIYAASVLK